MAVLSVEQAIKEARARVGPAVVGLGRGWGPGTGVVIENGRVLTGAHNLRSAEATVSLGGGERVTGSVAGIDHDLDIAVLAVDTSEATPVEWAASSDLDIGTPVIALADPGGRGLRVTSGHVAAAARSFRGPRGRRIRGAIEHTAPLPRGSSGGPLVDSSNRLVGINALRLEGGLILALGADAAMRERVERLGRGEAPRERRLGVAVAPPRAARRMRRAVGLPEREGLLVRAVEDDAPAARAGIERGDLLVAAGGRELDGIDALHEALDSLGADGSLELGVVRGVDELALTVSFDASEGGLA